MGVHLSAYELTPREREAAQIAACGHTNKEVAARMNLTEGTVKQYLTRVYDKTGAVDRSQLTYKLRPIIGESL